MSDIDTLYDSDEDTAAREAAVLRLARDHDAWVWLLSSTHGRRIARSLVIQTQLIHAGPPSDALTQSYLEGRRSVGLQVFNAVRDHAPEHLTTLCKDSIDE